MRFNNKNAIKHKCKSCNSYDIKKRRNFSHGTSSGAKISYYCNACKSTSIEHETVRRNFNKNSQR